MKKLSGKKAIVTVGPTIERIDPVRYISNFSSGKQGYAIAGALADNGAEVILIAANVKLDEPKNMAKIVRVESAAEMLSACEENLPCDIAVFSAAVCDFRVENISAQKIKKKPGEDRMTISLVKNPDILATIGNHKNRPGLVIGFAAETENLIDNAKAKLVNKNCDFILANDISKNVFGQDENQMVCVSRNHIEEWPRMSKNMVAERIVEIIFK